MTVSYTHLFALEPYLRAAQFMAQVGAVKDRAWTSCIMDEKVVEFLHEAGVGQGRLHSRSQFIQAGLDWFGNILAAVSAEKAVAVRFVVGCGMLAHAISLLLMLCRRHATWSAAKRRSAVPGSAPGVGGFGTGKPEKRKG